MKNLLFIFIFSLFLSTPLSATNIALRELTGKDVSRFNIKRVNDLLVDEFKNQGRTISLIPDDFNFDFAYSALSLHKDSQTSQRLDNTILEAKILYDNMQFDKTIEKLKDGILQYLNNILFVDSNESYKKAKLMLALSFIANNKEEEGVGVFSDILAIDPNFNLSTNDVSPKILDRFNSLKSELKKAKLEIETNAKEPSLYIDGAFIKSSKDNGLEVSVAIGEHYVRISQKGYYPNSAKIALFEDSKIKIKLDKIDLASFFKLKEERKIEKMDLILLNAIRNKLDSEHILNGVIFRKNNRYYFDAESVDLATGKSTLTKNFELGRDLLSPKDRISEFVKMVILSMSNNVSSKIGDDMIREGTN